jgi:hypothetical protein
VNRCETKVLRSQRCPARQLDLLESYVVARRAEQLAKDQARAGIDLESLAELLAKAFPGLNIPGFPGEHVALVLDRPTVGGEARGCPITRPTP